MSDYSTYSGQDIIDLSLQLYGVDNAVVRIATENPEFFDSLNKDIPGGTVLSFTEEPDAVRTFLVNRKIDISTSDVNSPDSAGFSKGFSTGFNS